MLWLPCYHVYSQVHLIKPWHEFQQENVPFPLEGHKTVCTLECPTVQWRVRSHAQRNVVLLFYCQPRGSIYLDSYQSQSLNSQAPPSLLEPSRAVNTRQNCMPVSRTTRTLDLDGGESRNKPRLTYNPTREEIQQYSSAATWPQLTSPWEIVSP